MSGPRSCWCPSFQLRLGAPDCAPELAIATWPVGHFPGSAAHNYPTTVQERYAKHKVKFLQHKRAHAAIATGVSFESPGPAHFHLNFIFATKLGMVFERGGLFSGVAKVVLRKIAKPQNREARGSSETRVPTLMDSSHSLCPPIANCNG